MALQVINTGTSPNDLTGDSLRVAMQKINANFAIIYAKIANDIGDVDPEGVVDGAEGNIYWNRTLKKAFVKESVGSGNTGWYQIL